MNAPRDVKVTWNGKTGTMAEWTGPDTPDGGSHLAFAAGEPGFRCPCGWRHRLSTVDGEDRMESWGLVRRPAPA